MENIKWVAQFHAKDDVKREIIKLGIKKERHLYFACFDFDQSGHERVGTSEQEVMEKIQNTWGDWGTFELI